MRTRIIYIAIAALALAGCVPQQDFFDTSEGGIILNLVLEDVRTKDTRPGDGALNENKLPATVDIFFYDDTLAVKKEVIGAILANNTLVQIETNPDDLEHIFGTLGVGAHCGVFVVANFSGTYQGTAGSRTLTQIKNSLIQAPAWETLPQASFVMTGEEQLTLGSPAASTPVYSEVKLSRVAAKVTFDVTVSENIEGNWYPVTTGMSVYMVYAMRKATLGAEPVEMPVSASATYGTGETVVYSQYVDKILYDTGTTRLRPRGNGTSNLAVYSTTHDGRDNPFYSYPCSWETGSAMEPYMKLIIPWKYGTTTRKYYYKIPFHGNSLERNHWYHISIDVQVLGTEQADPPEVSVHYAIADWQGEIDTSTAEDITSVTSVPATVITARYLNIPTTEYVLFNEERLVIPVQSSHDMEIVGFTVDADAYQASHYTDAHYVGDSPRIYNPFTATINNSIIAVRANYSATTATSVSHEFPTGDSADSEGWMVKIAGRDSIVFSHPLNRNLSSNAYDVAPYTIRFRVRHQGDATGYFTDITIEQRPPIIIRPYANSGGTSRYGYGFVNGAQNNGRNNGNSDGSYTSSSTQSSWLYYLGASPDNMSNSATTNTNMYVIETSVLPTTGSLSSYVLGDPRTRTIDNLQPQGQDPWSQSKASVTGTNRRLSYYYPAGDEAYDNFIAPKMRIASSFGATQPVTFENAQRRCASYQEDGYPAGRWRLPTVAEIFYISQLNTDGKIFKLLGSENIRNNNNQLDPTTDYWCNSTFVTVANGTNAQWRSNYNKDMPAPEVGTSFSSSDTKYIRCVYDDWYWEGTKYSTVTKDTFTWGDQDRSDVRMAD